MSRSSFTCFPGARPGRNGERRPGFRRRAGLARELTLRLPAGEAFGMARQIFERVFQRADAAQQGGGADRVVPVRNGDRLRKHRVKQAGNRDARQHLLLAPVLRPFLRPAKVLRRKALQGIDERKGRERSSSFQSHLQLLTSPAGKAREAPSLSFTKCRWRR